MTSFVPTGNHRKTPVNVCRQVTVRAQKPADVLGVYVYLPAVPGGQ
jgi:hypothetical protein